MTTLTNDQITAGAAVPLPCPFCDGAAEVQTKDIRGRVIECSECGASVGAVDLERGYSMWNRRAPSPQVADIAELSKGEIDAIVYRCRQQGNDTTYDIVNAAIAASPQIAEKVELLPVLQDAAQAINRLLGAVEGLSYVDSAREFGERTLTNILRITEAAPASAGQAGQVAKAEPTTIVQDVAALFRACGFDVREEPSALDPKGEFAIAGSLDAGGLLVESVIEHCENLRLAGAARQGGATQPSTAPTERAAAPAELPSAQKGGA